MLTDRYTSYIHIGDFDGTTFTCELECFPHDWKNRNIVNSLIEEYKILLVVGRPSLYQSYKQISINEDFDRKSKIMMSLLGLEELSHIKTRISPKGVTFM